MFNKKISLILLILVFMLSISAVSAADTNSSDDIVTSSVDEEPPSGISEVNSDIDNLSASTQNDYKLESSDLKMYERDGSSFDATLLKGTSPVKDASVIFSINGKNYTYKTDSSGVASLPIGLRAGTYDISTYYGKLSNTNKIVVSPIVIGNDLNMFQGSGESYSVKFLNTNGKALANTNITFSVNGKSYIKKTDSKGVAKLPIGLRAGSYTITSIHPNGAKISKKILVVDAIKASDLKMVYKSGTAFTAQFFNVDGEPLANTEVIFNIIKKNYTKKTDSNGMAKLTINLRVNNYTITAIHPSGIKLSKNINIVNAINADDLTMTYNSGVAFTAEFLDAGVKPLANKDIIFSINGKNYTKQTDSNGVAKLPIGLRAGSYTITSIHPNGAQVSNKIVVKTSVVASDLTKHYLSSKQFTATFYGKNGKVLANKNIKFQAKGTTYTVKTDSNGKATLKIVSTPDKFDVVSINSETGEKVTKSVEVLPTLVAKDMTVFSDVTSKFKVTLYNGESLAKNTKMNIYVDGVKYSVTTDSNGVGTLNFKLAKGTHVFKSVDPITQYSITNNVVVKLATITADDMRAKENTTTTFKATLLKENGDVSPNTNMKITINGVTKTVKTNSKGVASYSFKLPKGVYSAVCKDLSNGYTLTKKISVGTTYNQYGVSDDGKTILAIGRASASGEYANYGYSFYKAEYNRTCPYCGSHELYWSIFWAGNEYTDYGVFPATGNKEGSSAEGLILCAHCDCDWSIFGHDHSGIYDLTCLMSPVKTTKDDAYALLEGNYVLT